MVSLVIAVAACDSAGTPAVPSDRTQAGALVALDARTGRTLWVRNAAKGRMMSATGSDARSVFAYDQRCTDESIGRGRLIAFDPTSASPRWSRRLSGVAVKTDAWGRSPTVDVGAGGVVVTPGGRFGSGTAVVSAATGQPRSSSRERFLGVSEQHVFAASDGEPAVLVARDRRTGRRQWTFPATPSTSWDKTFDVVAANRTHVVVASGNYLSRSGNRPGSATTFFVLAARSGRQEASFTAADPSFQFSDMLIADDALVYGEGTMVVARDLITGAVRWTQPFADATVNLAGVPGVLVRAVIGADTMLLVDVQAGAGRTVALDGRSGAVLWEHPGASVAIASPTVTLLQPRADEVIAVATPTGRRLWRNSKIRAVAGPYGELSYGLGGRRLAVGAVCDTG